MTPPKSKKASGKTKKAKDKKAKKASLGPTLKQEKNLLARMFAEARKCNIDPESRLGRAVAALSDKRLAKRILKTQRVYWAYQNYCLRKEGYFFFGMLPPFKSVPRGLEVVRFIEDNQCFCPGAADCGGDVCNHKVNPKIAEREFFWGEDPFGIEASSKE